MNDSFDLESAIQAWRVPFSAREGIGASQVAELEDHLRQCSVELIQQGLSREEAFLVAAHRVGGEGVAQEMQKADPDRVWASRAKWMFLGVLGYQALSSVLQVAGALMQTGIAFLKPGMLLLSVGTFLASALTLAVFAWSVWCLAKGQWRMEPSSSVRFLQKSWALALLMVCIFMLGRVANYLHVAVAVRVLSLTMLSDAFLVTQCFSLGEALLILVVFVFAVQRARLTAEA